MSGTEKTSEENFEKRSAHGRKLVEVYSSKEEVCGGSSVLEDRFQKIASGSVKPLRRRKNVRFAAPRATHTKVGMYSTPTRKQRQGMYISSIPIGSETIEK